MAAGAVYTYSDWTTITDKAARLVRLGLHMQEVAERISAEVSGDGRSRSTSSLQQYYDGLLKAYDKLQAQVEASGTGAVGSSGPIGAIRLARP